MAIDSTLPVRRAVLAFLKSSAGVTALVPPGNIHPQAPRTTPVWPFIRWGAPTAVPLKASCLDGQDMAVAVHCFSKGRRTGRRLVESAEDDAAHIGAAVARVLDGLKLRIAHGAASVRVTGSSLQQDGDEADAFHAIVNLRIRCITN